jgi:hypothetical protein
MINEHAARRAAAATRFGLGQHHDKCESSTPAR